MFNAIPVHVPHPTPLNQPNAISSPEFLVIDIHSENSDPNSIDVAEDKKSYVAIDMPDEEITRPYNFEKLIDFISQLKTCDQSLKTISNFFKIHGMKKQAKLTKELRNFVKYLTVINHYSQNESDRNQDLNLLEKIQNPQAFKKMIEKVNNAYSLVNQSLTYLEDLDKNFKVNLGLNSQIKTANNFLPLLSFPQNEIVLLYKIASLRTSIQYWQKPDEDNWQRKNLVLLRSAIETVRSSVKTGLHLTGYKDPYIQTALTISGLATGVMGLYLIYTDNKNQPQKQ